MVALNAQYAPKGLQMIGISLDNSRPDMLRVAKEKGFNWPQMCDMMAWNTPPAREWGVQGIPKTFILGPDGTVLWSGHPARIDAPLAEAFAKHPPQLVDPKIMAEATAAADKIEAALKENGHSQAIKLLATIPTAARVDTKFADRVAAIEKEFEAYANKSLEEIDPLIQDKQYVAAATKLSDLTRALGALPAGANAKRKLSELMSNPEAKAQFEAAQKAKFAEEEIAIAKKLQADGKDEQAYTKFKQIATTFANTPVADEAKAAIATYEKNPELVKKANDSAVSGKAKAALGMAANYARAGRKDQAKAKYQDVIKQFPGTSFAKEAEIALKDMEGK
jgi:hypothetical protein